MELPVDLVQGQGFALSLAVAQDLVDPAAARAPTPESAHAPRSSRRAAPTPQHLDVQPILPALGENLGDLLIASSSQVKEPPRRSGRFMLAAGDALVMPRIMELSIKPSWRSRFALL